NVAPMRAIVAVINLADEPAGGMDARDDRVAAGDPITAAAEHLVQRDFDRDRLDSLDFHGPMLQDDRRRVPIIGRSGGAAYPFRAPSRCASLAPCPVRSLPAPSLRLRIRDAAPGMIEGDDAASLDRRSPPSEALGR